MMINSGSMCLAFFKNCFYPFDAAISYEVNAQNHALGFAQPTAALLVGDQMIIFRFAIPFFVNCDFLSIA